jgi:ubiquinol-cytochrome c reductase cytochrome b subunit
VGFWDELDARVGHRALLRAALDEPVPGGARFAYAMGSVLVVLLLLQVATGVALAFVYTPSVTGAWASVAYLESTVPAGAIVRGLHHFGASALVVVLALHLGQTALFGAYRKPRELTWWSGLALGGLILAFSLTGYLLPWDQRGYWATQVATDIAGSVPLVGAGLERLLEGGNGLGNLTLTRFYATHVLLLPAATVALLAFHLFAFRKHGVTPHWKADDRVGRFWPDQLWRDALLAFIAVLATLLLAWHGAPLQAPADPSGHAEPRPEWYFLPLYELLKLFSGRAEVVASIVVPAAGIALLAGLPFLDRSKELSPRWRWRPLLALALLATGAATLGIRSLLDDRHDPRVVRTEAMAEVDAKRAIELARGGVPPEGALALLQRDPGYRGGKLFDLRCAGCHAPASPELEKAPRLEGLLSPSWIEGLLRDPDATVYYGHTKSAKGMDSYVSRGAEKLAALSTFLAALKAHDVAPEKLPAELGAGLREFKADNCDTCHSLTPGEASAAPNLAGYGGERWLDQLLDDPGGPLAYGAENGMPSIRGKLSADDRAALVTFVRSLRGDAPP